MSKYIIYGHMKSITSKNVGETFHGAFEFGIIGNSSNYSMPTHLHFGAIDKCSFIPTPNDFINVNKPYIINPQIFIDVYGKPSPNDITGYYKEMYSNEYGDYPHEGIDYSGVIDRSYETSKLKTLPNAKTKLVRKGYHSNYGNYAIFEILGKKEEVKNMFELVKIGEVKDYVIELWFKVNNEQHDPFKVEQTSMELWKKNSNGGYKEYEPFRDLQIIGRSFNNSNNVARFKLKTSNIPDGTYEVIGVLQKDGKKFQRGITSNIQMTSANILCTNKENNLLYQKGK